MIGILDYGVGNVGAFLRIFHSQNILAMPVTSAREFDLVDKIILPGVGSFDTAMRKLNDSGLRGKLDDVVLNKKMPLLGVCIGMHMLGGYSEEGSLSGLNYIAGYTKRIPVDKHSAISLLPHMGWNGVIEEGESDIWRKVNLSEGFYFLHSYTFVSDSKKSVIGTSDYGGKFESAIKSNDVYGFQFHPEKSLSNGVRLLTNFAEKS